MRKHCLDGVKSQEGQSLMEFALTLPLVLLVVFGVLDLGFAVYASNTVALAAREGARAGVVYAGSDSATRQNIIRGACHSAVLLNLDCNTSNNRNISISPSSGITHSQQIIVTVVYTYSPFTPVIGNVIGSGQFPFRSKSSMYVE